jgi:hypothetical protein
VSCCDPQGDGALGPTFTTSAVISVFDFMHRTSASPVTAPAAAWDLPNGAPYTTSNVLSSERIAGDTVDLVAALQWVSGNDQSAREMQFVSRPMPAGVSFAGAVAWLIGRNGTVTGTVRPWLSLRVFDITCTILRATLIALGEHGSGTNCNANGTRLWAGSVAGGVPLASYVTAEGDRRVLEVGYRMTGAGTANAGIGSFATNAGNTNALHVCSTLAEGVNPGSRAPYLELQNVTWPRAA